MRSFLAASLLMLSGTAAFGADLCLGPYSKGMNITVDCEWTPGMHKNSWTGFSTSGTPCTSHEGGAIAM